MNESLKTLKNNDVMGGAKCTGRPVRPRSPTPLPLTITEKMATLHFPSNALRSKSFMKAKECFLKDRRKAGGRFVYSVFFN